MSSTADGQSPGSYRRDCIFVSLAVGVVALTFGVFADAAGFDLAQIFVMSALVFTGASQFTVVSIVGDGGSGGAALGAAMIVAARNMLYGPLVRRVLPETALARLAAAHFVLDQTTAMAVSQPDRRDARGAFWWTAITLWFCWNAASIGGALLGDVLGDPGAWGLDAAFPAMFLALLAPHLASAQGRIAALLAAVIAAGVMPVTAAGIPILLSVAAIPPALYVRRFRRHRADAQSREAL